MPVSNQRHPACKALLTSSHSKPFKGALQSVAQNDAQNWLGVLPHQLAQTPAGRATARGTLQADEAPALPHTFVTTPSSMESTSIQTAERLPPISGPRPTRVQPRSSAALRNHNRMDELLRRDPAGFSAALPGSLCKGLERHGIDEALTHQALQADWGATSDRCAVLAGVLAPRPGGLTPVGCCPNWWVSSAPGCNGFRSLAFDRSNEDDLVTHPWILRTKKWC